MRDVPFLDSLGKLHTKAVGWMPTKQFEGKIEAGHVLVAEAAGEKVGYCIGNDRYFKRDDVGIIYQMNVVPNRQRGLIGASLLTAQFERSAYGCRLYCCWCAQDLPANRFWESMGFVPLAYRVGSLKRGKKGAGGGRRVHIFWQKRIVRGDETTCWWYPSKTDGGALRSDRIALPIPPGTRWDEVEPVLLPGMGLGEERAKALLKPRKNKAKVIKAVEAEQPSNGLRFAIPKPAEPEASTEVVVATEPEPKREKPRCDPKLIEAARELRDRYLEQIAAEPWHLEAAGKYDVARALPGFERDGGGGAMQIEARVVKALPKAA
jgi:hypothetical protein